MPQLVTLLRVFLSSPSDLSEERKIARDVIDNFNVVFADSGIRLELLTWETHTYSSIGTDPQRVVNSQIGDDYDIFVGMLWARFGTPTPRADSGTEEEFNRALARSTSTNVRLLFFFKNSSPDSLDSIDSTQLEKVRTFKKSIQNKGLVWSFSSAPEFSDLLFKHLAMHTKGFRTTWGFDAQSADARDRETLAANISAASNMEDGNARNMQADGITITPSKKVYARVSPYTDWKKEISVRYPVISGVKSESVLYKINEVFSYEKIFDMSLSKAIDKESWLDNLDYTVEFVKRPFLNLRLIMEGTGAYSSHWYRSVVVDVQTGERLYAKDLFEEFKLGRLASVVDQFVQANKKLVALRGGYVYNEIGLDSDADHGIEEHWLESYIGNLRFKVEDLDHFSLSETGVTFLFEFPLPHVALALGPGARYYFEYTALKQFIKRGSALDDFLNAHKAN